MTHLPRCITTKEYVVWSTQTYTSEHIYNFRRYFDTNTDVTMIQCQNNP